MRQLAPELQQRAAELYTSGLNAARTAAALGVSKTAILASLRRNGVPVRPAKCPHPVPIDSDTRNEAERRYAAGETVWMDRKRRLADIISATIPGRSS